MKSKSKPLNHSTTRVLRGFTIVELLVAIAITSGLILFINQIVVSMSSAVSLGIGNSQIVQKSRIINEQIKADVKNIPSDHSNSFMTIFQYEVDSIWADSQVNPSGGPGVLVIESDADDSILTTVRSDQIAFIREAGNLKSVTPRGINAFTPAHASDAYAKVWYGHARRTAANGDDRGDLDRLGVFSFDANQQIDGENALASQWVLGRQAMLLGNTTGSPIVPISLIFAENFDPTVDENKGGARWHAPINPGGGTAGTDYLDVSVNGTNVLASYMGLTDITSQTHAELLTTPAIPPAPAGAVDTGINEQALNAIDYAYPVQRLRVNPKPYFDIDGATPHNYQSWQMAQMHPLLAENISDFTVEFAGDFDAIPGIDVVDATEATDIAAEMATDPLTLGTLLAKDIVGTIKWYSAYYNDPRPSVNSYTDKSGLSLGYVPDKPLSFRPPVALFDTTEALAKSGNLPIFLTPDHNGLGSTFAIAGGAAIPAPKLPINTLNPNNVPIRNADAIFIFRPGGGAWPKLLRFRYRLHDKRGKITDADAAPGVLFEVIVPVP